MMVLTLEIVYEGFTHNAEVEDKEGMDGKFEDVFSEYNLTKTTNSWLWITRCLHGKYEYYS